MIANLTRTSTMLSRAINKPSAFQALNFQTSSKKESATTTTEQVTKVEESTAATTTNSHILNRFVTTAEVTVSKIFPAGFGWQTASILADNAGMEADSLGFALSTGFGDAVGVFVGHNAFYALKKSAGFEVNMTETSQTGLLLGSAAMFSGSAWQPTVNLLQGMSCEFTTVFAGTWLSCAAAFYTGLRVTRSVLSNMEYIEEATYENSKADIALSTSIGGATGFFVGTDAAYLPDQNFLINIVGITPNTTDLVGCAIAGSSTSLGFMASQGVQNVAIPKGKNWTD